MHALRDFLSTDYGLLSAFVIAFTLGMGVFFSRYFARHIREDTERAAREAAAAEAANAPAEEPALAAGATDETALDASEAESGTPSP